MIPVPEHILDSLSSAFGINRQDLTFLGGGEESSDGIAYTFHHDSGPRVLKVMAFGANEPERPRQIDERIRFVHYLGENGVNIVSPLPDKNGALLATARAGDVTFVAYVMEKVEGTHRKPEQWDDDLIYQWGKTIGYLHRVTQTYHSGEQPPDSSLGWQQEVDFFTGWCRDPEIKEWWRSMRRRLESLPKPPDAYGFIHNDPHDGNILWNAGRIILLDFDVANYHWFMVDLTIPLQSILFHQSGGFASPLRDGAPLRRFFDVFLRGYWTENQLEPSWLERIDMFINYRRALLFTVSQDWLAQHPDICAQWKKMILEEPPILTASPP